MHKKADQDGKIAAAGFTSSGSLCKSVLQRLGTALERKPGLLLALLPDAAPGTLNIICSLPSMGKTAFLVNAALRLQEAGKNVAVFLPEYTPEEFMHKALIVKGGLNHVALRYKLKTAELLKVYKDAAAKLPGEGLYVYRCGRLVEHTVWEGVGHLAAALKAGGRRLDAVIIDSLNYLRLDEEAEDEAPGVCELVDMAEHFGVSVIASFGMRSVPDARGHIQLADTRLAGLDEREGCTIHCLNRPEFYDRQDPTIKNKAVLERLYPYLSPYTPAVQLNFTHETLTFSVQPPIAFPGDK